MFLAANLDGSGIMAPWDLINKLDGVNPHSTLAEKVAALVKRFDGDQKKTEAGKAFKSLTCIINGETHVFEGPHADLKVVLTRLRQSLGAGKIMDDNELTKKNSVRNAKADAKRWGRTKGQFWVGTTSRKDMHPNLGQKTWPKNSPYVIFFESLEPATTEQDAPGDSDARSAGDQA